MKSARKKVTYLRLQPVLPLCEVAIDKVKTKYPGFRNCFINTANTAKDLYVWVDKELFINALVAALSDCYECLSINKCMTIFISTVDTATFRFMVTGDSNLDLSNYKGPFSASQCIKHKNGLAYVMDVMKKHGGTVQVWNKADLSDCVIEINMVCICKQYPIRIKYSLAPEVA